MSKKSKEIVYYIDNIYHLRWEEGQIRRCPHPYMIKHYGHGGVCIVPVCKCIDCEYVVLVPHHGARGCGYGKEPKNGNTEK